MDKSTVVVIDDDADDLAIMEDVIRNIDPSLDCITYSDPAKALEGLLGNLDTVPGFIFLDYNMPKLRGDGCLKLLRHEDRFDGSVIVMISTSMSALRTTELFDSGANYAVEKPNKLDDYYTLLKSIFRNHR